MNLLRLLRVGLLYNATMLAALADPALSSATVEAVRQPAAAVIGRPVRIVTLSFRAGSDINAIAQLVDEQAAKGVDLIVLPETWSGKNAESIDGPATTAMANLARKHHSYIVSPIYRSEGRDCYNSAVLLDRDGQVAGIYDKVFPFPPEYLEKYHGLANLKCGHEARVFATDFGKIGLAICFDVNFPELWQQMEEQGAELVIWPSAYPGGVSLQAQAALNHYYVVSATHNARETMNCPVYDISGEAIAGAEIPEKRTSDVTVARVTLDLDRTIFGNDYGHLAQAQQLVTLNPKDIALEKNLPHEGWFIMKSTTAGVSVRELARRAGLPTLRESLKEDRQALAKRRSPGL